MYAGDQIIENVTTGYLYFQDSLGNTSHVTDAAGNLLESYTYSAFGQPSFFNSTSQPLNSSTYNIKHLFQGQLWTQETGLNDYRNRVELPTMGVFLQPDPIGFKGDAANVYRFCNNNAVNRLDPMGLFQQPAVFLGYAPGEGLEGPGRDLAQRLGENNRRDLAKQALAALAKMPLAMAALLKSPSGQKAIDRQTQDRAIMAGYNIAGSLLGTAQNDSEGMEWSSEVVQNKANRKDLKTLPFTRGHWQREGGTIKRGSDVHTEQVPPGYILVGHVYTQRTEGIGVRSWDRPKFDGLQILGIAISPSPSGFSLGYYNPPKE